jgi:hypothetical protein
VRIVCWDWREGERHRRRRGRCGRTKEQRRFPPPFLPPTYYPLPSNSPLSPAALPVTQRRSCSRFRPPPTISPLSPAALPVTRRRSCSRSRPQPTMHSSWQWGCHPRAPRVPVNLRGHCGGGERRREWEREEYEKCGVGQGGHGACWVGEGRAVFVVRFERIGAYWARRGGGMEGNGSHART